jgi:hypothetical protein
VQRVEGPGAVTSDDLAPSGRILHRTAKRVKFHTAVVINSKLTNRNEILNEVWCNKNVIKTKVVKVVRKPVAEVAWSGTEQPGPADPSL